MAWVYRYVDQKDGIKKYVGVVWGESRTLKQRIKEHLKEDWCKTSSWRVEYIENDIETRAEAEAFETHYIALYDTGKYYNKRQVGYGTNKFLPNREDEWKLFTEVDGRDHFIEFDGKKTIYVARFNEEEGILSIIKKDIGYVIRREKVESEKRFDYCTNCYCENIYLDDNHGYPVLRCCKCNKFIGTPRKELRSLYTPYYIGEYKKDQDGNYITKMIYPESDEYSEYIECDSEEKAIRRYIETINSRINYRIERIKSLESMPAKREQEIERLKRHLDKQICENDKANVDEKNEIEKMRLEISDLEDRLKLINKE